MKKFSNLTNQTVGQEPKVETTKIDEKKVLKVKMIKLMEDLLSIETFGPIDRFQRFGLIKIKGQEILTEAIINLINYNKIESQIKVLESLKTDVKDWKAIDVKIEELNSNNEDYKLKFKIDKILEKYNDDEEFFVKVICEKMSKINNKNKLSSYLKYINNLNISEDVKIKINNTFNAKS